MRWRPACPWEWLFYLVLIGWGLFMLWVKFRLAHFGLATDDLYNYANGLYNTNFWDKWLYLARYEIGRGLSSLMFVHWQPTTLLLWPLVHLFGGHSLLVVQALAPVWASWFLWRIGAHAGLSAGDRMFCVGICLFSPYMMLAVMDSIYGFHATSLLLWFGAPLAWAAVTRRWGLALVLLLFFVNIREIAATYVAGAAIGFAIFHSPYFDNFRRAAVAAAIAGAVFLLAVKGAPLLANASNFHFDKLGHIFNSSALLKLDLSEIDKDWAAFVIGLWPAVFAPGAAFALAPEAGILLIADEPIVHWYGMSLVFAGALAATFGLAWLRRCFASRLLARALTVTLVVHIAVLSFTSFNNVIEKSKIIIDRYGYHIPDASLEAARASITQNCRTSVFFQAMKGFGDLPFLLYPHPTQAESSHYIVVSKREELNLLHNRLQREFVAGMTEELTLRYEDAFLAVYERPATPCVASKRTGAGGT